MADSSPLEPLRQACARPLDFPALDAQRRAGDAVLDFLLDDFNGLADRPVGQSATRPALEALLGEPPPEQGADFADVLRAFRAKVVGHAYRPQHPRFLAFVPGVPTYPSVLGDWLCGASNFFAGNWKEAAGPAQVELLVLDWFRQLLGLPDGTQGLLTGGGSEATLTALVTARERLPFADRARAVLYASDQRHWSFDRAVKIAGFHPDQLRLLPADADLRLCPATLRAALAEDAGAGRLPWFVFASAGTTNTGSVDPLAALADLRDEHRLWLHVDAAYGWAAALTDEGCQELRGIERADSVTLDPHKWFGQTFDVGCLLVRHGAALEAAFASRPEYLQDVEPGAGEVNFADRGIALTRRFRALKIWFAVKVLGLAWFRRLVEHGVNLARYAQRLLEDTGTFELLSPRRLSVLCFRYAPAGATGLDRLNLALCEEVNRTGRFFLATTRLRGAIALRLCFVNWRTSAADVEELVRSLREIGALLCPR